MPLPQLVIFAIAIAIVLAIIWRQMRDRSNDRD